VVTSRTAAPTGRRTDPPKRAARTTATTRSPKAAEPTDGKDSKDSETRHVIIAAAKRCFAEHGYKGTTNKMISTAAGVAPGLIYYYFDSKEQLFVAVFDDMYESRDARLVGYDFGEHSLRDNLARMLEDSTKLAHEDTSFVDVFTLSGREVSRNPGLAEAWDAHWERVVHVYFRIVDAAVANGEVPKEHRDGLVDVLVAWFSGFLMWVARQPDERRIDEAADEFLRMVASYVPA
jgi:AcrR family transcriptional regulator